jgi:hypothetical protein
LLHSKKTKRSDLAKNTKPDLKCGIKRIYFQISIKHHTASLSSSSGLKQNNINGEIPLSKNVASTAERIFGQSTRKTGRVYALKTIQLRRWYIVANRDKMGNERKNKYVRFFHWYKRLEWYVRMENLYNHIYFTIGNSWCFFYISHIAYNESNWLNGQIILSHFRFFWKGKWFEP